jgi:GNAT superfamily N-acetyltransferase
MSVDTSAIVISELRPDDSADVDASFELERAANAIDVPDFPPPSRRRHLVGLRRSQPGTRDLRWLARVGDEPVGLLTFTLPILDNLDNVEVELLVHPDHRRRGVGRALYAHAMAAARNEGRHTLIGMSAEALPGGSPRPGAGSAFAAALGAQAALTDVRRRLTVTDVDDAVHEALLAQAWTHANGYAAVQWGGQAPDEFVDDVARLDARLVTDAPLGDLAWEAEQIDAARIRAGEEFRAECHTRSYSTAVRHEQTGQLVALSALVIFDGIPYHAWQAITLVDPAHRGRRLGTIVKVENLRYAVAGEPELRTIDTWNAAVNDHMIGINEAMGFRPVDAWVNWQVKLPVVDC